MLGKPDLHPLAINIIKLQRYNFEFLSCEEVVFFEYIVIKGKSFGKIDSFFHSTSTITKETGIKKHSLKTIISSFEKHGIIKVEVKGMPRVKYFKVIYPRIIELLPNIYQLSENGKLQADFSKLLFDFFQPLADSYLKKNNSNKNNQKENQKEILSSDSDWNRDIISINEFISSLSYKNHFSSTAFKYDESIIYKAVQYYGCEVIITNLSDYFNDKGNYGSISDFLKPDKIDNRKLIYIERKIIADNQFVDSFIKQLNDTYNERRKMASNKKRTYSETSLPINNAIRSQIKEALKAKSDTEISHAFLTYCDQVLKGVLVPKKFLPYFFSKQFNNYNVIDTCLDHFNLNYSISN